jgi:hypothetical protein
MLKIFLIFILLTPYGFSQEKVRIGYSDLVFKIAPDYPLLVKRLYSNIGVEVENVVLPSGRAISAFEKGNVDALGIRINGYSLINKEALPLKTSILNKSVTRAWALKGNVQKLKSQDFISYVALRGDISPKVYEIKAGIKITNFVTSFESAIKMLERGRVDSLVMTNELLVFSKSYDKFTPLNDIVVSHSLHHFLHSSKKHLLPQIEVQFEKAKEAGLFKKITKKLER